MPPKKTVSSTQRAIAELRELIFSGNLAAGSDHLESELAERLGMSRTPIREAVLTLAGQGLIEMRPRKGARVVPLSPSDMAEIYDVLIELESCAAATAAQAGHSPSALAAMAKSIDDMDRALAKEDREEWAKADEQFHSELVSLSGNSRIIGIVAMMRDQVRRARATTLYMRPLPVASNDAHRTVYEAIQNQQPDVARATHRDHRREAKEMLVGMLSQHQLNSL